MTSPARGSSGATTPLTWLIRCLILLGLVAQVWTLVGLWPDLDFISAEEVALCASPIALASVGAALAGWLRRRGSGWAWLAAGLPVAVLVLGLGLAEALTVHPISLHQP